MLNKAISLCIIALVANAVGSKIVDAYAGAVSKTTERVTVSIVSANLNIR